MATTDLERLVVSVEANTSKIESQLEKLTGTVDGSFKRIQQSTDSVVSAVEGGFEKMSERVAHHIEYGLTRPLAEALSLRALIEFTRTVIDDFDKIATKAESLGITVDDNLRVKMEGIRSSWERSWADLEVAVANSGLASLIGLIGEGILALPRAAAHAVEGIEQSGLSGKDFMARDTAHPPAAAVFGPDYTKLAQTQATAGITDFYKAASALSDPTGISKLIAQMKIGVQLAADTVSQHEIDVKVIEAAAIKLADLQKEAAIRGDHLTQTSIGSIEQARQIVGQSGVAAIAELIQREFAAGVKQQLIQEIDSIRTNNAHPGAINEAGLSAEVKRNNLASIDAKGKQLQIDEKIQGREITYLDNLKDEARLAGLMPRLREEENALLDQKNRYGDDFKNQHEAEIRALVQEKQANQDLVQVQTAAIDAVANFGSTMQASGGKFGKAVASMLSDLAQLILKLEITRALSSAIGAGGGGSGWLGALFSGLFGASTGGAGGAVSGAGGAPSSTSGLASGGPVMPGGSYLVGESGPEMFVPTSAGRIVPNGGGRSGPGGMPLTINVYGGSGDDHIRDLVTAGVGHGLAQYDRQALPSRVANIMSDPSAR